MNTELKTDRVLELFFRALKGEFLSAKSLAEQYNVSARSISRACIRAYRRSVCRIIILRSVRSRPGYLHRLILISRLEVRSLVFLYCRRFLLAWSCLNRSGVRRAGLLRRTTPRGAWLSFRSSRLCRLSGHSGFSIIVTRLPRLRSR